MKRVKLGKVGKVGNVGREGGRVRANTPTRSRARVFDDIKEELIEYY